MSTPSECFRGFSKMNDTHTNAEAGTAKAIRALKSIERISRPEKGLGYCNIDPIDLLKTINEIALRTISESKENGK